MWKKISTLLILLVVVPMILTLSDNERVHAQGSELNLKVGKLGINRELNYSLRGWDAILESVEVLNDKLMALHFCITNNTGKDQSTWVPKDYKSTIYITDNLGNKYPMLDFQGITKEPEKTRVPRGRTIRYYLIFPVFKEGTKAFSFTEGRYVFKNIQISLGQETITANPVVPNGKIGMFRHGTLVTKTGTGELILASSPSEATHTHAGVDIVANCGSPIYAFADGQVKDLINNENDNHFRALGYMMLIEHSPSLIGKTFYTLYLHMQNPPILSINEEVKASQEIGKVGDTGAAQGCHTHFEIRYFPTRFFEDPNWNDPWNIYGKGDQRSAKQFRENWGDPMVLLSQIRPLEQKVITSIKQSQLDKAAFRMIGCPGFVGNTRAEGPRAVRGDVPHDIDLSDDVTTKEVLEKAVQFAQEKCPQKVPYGDITVRLYQKDRRGLDIFMVNARNYDRDKLTWVEYGNRPLRECLAKEKKAEEEKRRLEKEEVARRGEERLIKFEEKGLLKQVVFSISIVTCGKTSFDDKMVRCDVPQEIDLSDEKKTGLILEEAVRFAEGKCPTSRYLTRVYLYQSSGQYPGQYKDDYVVAAHLSLWGREKVIIHYCENRALNKRREEEERKRRIEEQMASEARRRQEEERKRIEMEARKAKEEEERKEREEVRKRLKEFVDKNGVKEWVSLEKLSANPFVYEGKTVGIIVDFFKMLSATQGVFVGGFVGAIVVSDVPRGLFTSEASVVLAGRVLGNIETKLPLLGTTMVPHLKFVGVHICKYGDCRDIIPTKEK